MTDKNERGTQPGLLVAGAVIAIAGVILLIVRLVVGVVEPLGLISTVLVILSGVVLAWRPWQMSRSRR